MFVMCTKFLKLPKTPYAGYTKEEKKIYFYIYVHINFNLRYTSSVPF